MERLRKPYSGVLNIIRFNWPMYLMAIVAVISLLFISSVFAKPYISAAAILIAIVISVSLAVSYYVYDCSTLYKLDWLNDYINVSGSIVNIHAGFDETSDLLLRKYSLSSIIILDFYDPVTHTEMSIRRARRIYPGIPGTIKISTTNIPLPDNSADTILIIFAAHEIRNTAEKIHFFKETRRIVKSDGRIIVTEHIRNWRNFVAYNIGFFHFYSKQSWSDVFSEAGLRIERDLPNTPFISNFILRKNEITS